MEPEENLHPESRPSAERRTPPEPELVGTGWEDLEDTGNRYAFEEQEADSFDDEAVPESSPPAARSRRP